MSSATAKILLLGGHGKVSQALTPQVLTRWDVTTLIRDPAQKAAVAALGADFPERKLDIIVKDLEEVKTQEQAQSIIDSTEANYIVWSAGAGGKGGPERTFAIDKDACIAFIRAAAATDSVKKFLLVSYLGSRRHKAPWWRDDEWKATQEVNNGVLKNYYAAKLAADEALTVAGKARGEDFAAIVLRPGSLTDDEGQGKVSLGKTGARGRVRRGDVARVAAELLEKQTKSCWLDLLEGDEDVLKAVNKAVKEGVNCIDGENVEEMVGKRS